jgi:hypothetical protein
MTCLVDGSSAVPSTANTYPLLWESVVSTPTRRRGPRTCDPTHGTTSAPSASAAPSSAPARMGTRAERAPYAAKGCAKCGQPKPPGRGQRLCEDCKPPSGPKMCHGCGDEPIRGRGARYCAECHPIYTGAAERRKRARERIRTVKPCRGCGGVKGPGKRIQYCPACRRKRAEPRSCERCPQPARSKHAKLCADCKRAAVARQRQLHREWQRARGQTGAHSPHSPGSRDVMSQRIRKRLQAEREGKTMAVVESVKDGTSGGQRKDSALFPALPSAPLAAAIERRIVRARAGQNVLAKYSYSDTDATRGQVALELIGGGVSSATCKPHRGARDPRCPKCQQAAMQAAARRLYAWAHGESETVRFDIADAILQRAGWLWFDVWEPCEPCPEDLEHRKAITADGHCPRCDAYSAYRTAERAFEAADDLSEVA